jgi:uncharacterized protein YgfB (UPF0149 family)
MFANDSSQFQRLSQLLTPLDLAELHGLLCGLLCTRINLDRDQWLRHAREALADDREFSPTTDELLGQLFDEGVSRIGSFDEPITPVLPDDDTPLRQRVNALGDWCQGLLYGLGLGEIGRGDQLSEESQEFLRDVADIAQIGFDTDEGGETDENAYAEIVEYLRVGLLMIQQDIEQDHYRTH